MKFKNSLFLLVVSALAASAISMSAQNSQVIKGTVVSEDGKPLPGVVVLPDGGKADAAVTDENGAWTVNAAPSSIDGIEVSCLGFITVREQVGGRSVINIIMKEDTQLLDEVVVVGYGVQKKGNLTGSVTQINFNDAIESRPAMTTSSALAGLSAGLQVRQTSGQPGEDSASLRIRGNTTLNNNSPLVLVDGVEWSMDDVNPADIESVTVLKDASSTAIYGSRAANGVILITTKKGSGKASVTYSVQAVMQTPYNKIGWLSDYATHMELVNEAADNVDQAHLFSDSTIATWKAAQANPDGVNEYGVKNSIAYPNTDWWSEIYQNKLMHKHTISASGKSKSIGYNVSLSYIDNPGIIDNTGYKRYFGRVNVYGQVTKWLKVGGRIWGYHTDQERSNVGSLTSMNTQKMTPDIYPYSKSLGLYGGPQAPGQDPQAHNPLWDMNTSRGYTKNTQLFSDWYVNINFLKYFTWNTDIYYKDYRQEEMSVDNAFGKYDFLSDSYVISPADPAELYSYMYNKRENQVKFATILNYNQTVRKHEISAMVGYEMTHFQYRDFSSTKIGLQDPSVGDLNAVATPYASGGYGTEYAARSFFGRVNYAYAGKYLFEANLRVDGSSRFAPEYRWGFFPSFSAGWRISEEPWLKGTGKVDNLKLRLSWGQLGNNSIGNYDWQSTYGTANYVFGTDEITNGIAITSIKNYLGDHLGGQCRNRLRLPQEPPHRYPRPLQQGD